MAHVRVWRFRPQEGQERAFVDAYARDGSWARLFGRAPGFLGTSLLRPAESGGWWMTIDRWQSLGHFEAFGNAHGAEYRALDAALEDVAGEEEFVGAFEEED